MSGLHQDDLSPLKSAQRQVKNACDKLGLEAEVYEILKQPQKILEVAIPVKMDDNSTKVFTAYRVQHNNAVGPLKGGIRFHPTITRDEVTALSIWMTFKCSVTGIPYGGGKGAVVVDPHKLSQGELERLSRGYIAATYEILGEKIDIPAPDINTNAQIMAWMTDEYCKLTRHSALGVITGKPIEFGGSKGRTEATGLGVAITVREAAKKINLKMNETKISLQGFGNVGSYSAIYCLEQGAKIIALTEVDANLYNEDGIDIEALLSYKERNKTIKGFPKAKEISIDEFWDTKVDVFLPCAMANAITPQIANKINCKLIVEGANGPTTTEADEILDKKGILVVPDILANAGGVTVSYFEWIQNLYGYYWSAEEVAVKEEEAMVKAFDNIYNVKEEYKVPMRTAAYMYSIKKIASVMKLRGWY